MFQLNESNSFTDNMTAFIAHMQSVDAEMANILQTNVDKLMLLVKDGNRNANARQNFNTAVIQALDLLIAQDLNSENV